MVNVLFNQDKFYNADDDKCNHSSPLEYTFAPKKKKNQMNISVQLALINQPVL